ncbi:MAG: hypothetical protein GY851_26945 [bacterium]|nr:hypothetical protein [bacterium]
MNSEYSADQEPRDYTKWIWLSVIGVFVVMILALWLFTGMDPLESVVRPRHILIAIDTQNPAGRASAHEQAVSIRQRIVDGEDFGDMAQRYSQDPGSASRGGTLGWTPKGEFAEAFEKYVWAAPIGEISEPIQTSFGFHIIVVEDRKIAKQDLAKAEQQRRLEEMSSGDSTDSEGSN